MSSDETLYTGILRCKRCGRELQRVSNIPAIANAVVMADIFDANRLLIISNRWLLVEGPIQNVDNVIHVRSQTDRAARIFRRFHPVARFPLNGGSYHDGPSCLRTTASIFGSNS